MIWELLVRYIHFISILALTGALITEQLMIDRRLERKWIRKLAIIDAVYGIASIFIVGTGLTMWLWIGKGASFYSNNGFLHIKLTLFVIIALLSILPTIFFLKNRKGDADDIIEIPARIRTMIKIEVFLLFLIPIFAILMARGIDF